MKRIFFCLVFISTIFFNSLAQTNELKEAYNNVCSTLSEYKFTSEDANRGGRGKTTKIQLKTEGGYIIFTITDNFGNFADPFFGYKHGVKTIKVPINVARFYQPTSGNYVSITATERDKVEFTYKNKKEIIDGYQLFGTSGSVKKLVSDLDLLLAQLRNENFQGTLNGNTAVSNKNNKKAVYENKNNEETETKNKTNIGKYVQ